MSEEYLAARRRGLKEMRQAEVDGVSPYPAVLDELVGEAGTLAQVPVGLKEIPLDMIAGTKTAGRTNAFSRGFMPILEPGTEFAQKWTSLYNSQTMEGIREPIKVYEYMARFYVEEGNKRVSVSRFVDATGIFANVTRLMPRKADTKEYRLYKEFLKYFAVAGMYDVIFTEEGSYRKFARCLGLDLETPWPSAVIEDIRAAYAIFTLVYHQEQEKRRASRPDADAFLIYLKLFPLESLLNEPRYLLNSRIGRLWKEFQVDSRVENIELLETPEKAEETKPLENIGSTLRGLLQPREREKGRYNAENPLHMAFLYPGDPQNSSWIYGHELGRNEVESRWGGQVRTMRYDNCVTDEQIRGAVKDAVNAHAEMIFTISPTQMEETTRCALDYPHVKFLNCSINLAHGGVRTYYGRMHEAKYLMGALAACVADNHRIGYVADYPIYGIVTGINAFAIGASLIDPQAQIYLKWSTDKDTDWQREFEEEDVRVISGPELIRPAQASREYGVYQRGEDGQVCHLAAPVWNWGTYYDLIARIVLNGRWDQGNQASRDRAVNYWWGMSAGVVDVILSEKLPYQTVKLINILRGGIFSGHYSPFTGELRSQDGPVRDRHSRGLSSQEIITMNWLCDNVIGSLPKKSDLVEKAEAVIEVSGVAGVAEET